jgi:hypothetical protein
VPVPALWVVDIADRVHVSERSPPGVRSSSNGDPFADDLTIAVGTAAVCLAPLAMGYGSFGQKIGTPAGTGAWRHPS